MNILEYLQLHMKVERQVKYQDLNSSEYSLKVHLNCLKIPESRFFFAPLSETENNHYWLTMTFCLQNICP